MSSRKTTVPGNRALYLLTVIAAGTTLAGLYAALVYAGTDRLQSDVLGEPAGAGQPVEGGISR